MKIIIGLVLAVFLIILHYITISSLFKTKDDLTSVNGVIDVQRLIHISGSRHSFDAYILGLHRRSPHFEIQDDKKRAFNYLSTHDVIGKQMSILYDPHGIYNYSSESLASNVYGASINGFTIATLSESKHLLKLGMVGLIVLDILCAFWYRGLIIKQQKGNSD
jgi:hypothetical protein